jgi:hypothetical protein
MLGGAPAGAAIRHRETHLPGGAGDVMRAHLLKAEIVNGDLAGHMGLGTGKCRMRRPKSDNANAI